MASAATSMPVPAPILRVTSPVPPPVNPLPAVIVWSFFAFASIPSSFEPSVARSLPSTVPVTVILPVTSKPAPTSKFAVTLTPPPVASIVMGEPPYAVDLISKTLLLLLNICHFSAVPAPPPKNSKYLPFGTCILPNDAVVVEEPLTFPLG